MEIDIVSGVCSHACTGQQEIDLRNEKMLKYKQVTSKEVKGMSRKHWITGLALALCLLVGRAAVADDIEFNFEIPTIPFPPEISDVSNSAAVTGATSFTVTASVVGQDQKKGFCDVIPKSECTTSDWYQAPDPDVDPNPPQIQKVKVYYYINDGVTSASSADMTYDSGLAKYKADVSLSGANEGDTVTYYIVAIDTRGNVAAQVPDKNQRPCPSSSSWDDTLSTPSTASCSYATSYTQCNEYQASTPSPCSTSYTMNDKDGDVCGEPNSSGDQSPISGPGADKVDMLGVSAGADSSYICTKIGLGDPPPDPNDSAPIEGYLMIFFNPDEPDLNPADTHIENAYAITYAPEAVGSDPTLVKVLWSGDCVTNPNTSNPLDCKLISAVGASEDLKIEYNQGSLRFMTKKSGTGNPYNVSYNLIGGSTSSSILVGLTGEINLSGGTAFWITDLTPGFAFYHTNKTVTVEPPGEPSAPIVTSTQCEGGTSVCTKSASQPSSNTCTINFSASLDASFTDEYRIYRNTVNNSTTATQVGTVPDVDGTSSYSYPDSHSTLDGTKYYYFLTSYNSAAAKETTMANASKANCTVEDWVPPSPPSITNAATPAGNSKKCEIDWSVGGDDPSLSQFYLSRDGTPINYENPLNAGEGLTEYSFPDPATLELGTSYSYTVTAIDLGENTAESSSSTCVPEDLDAPSQISSVIASNISGKLGVSLEWQASSESDLAGYNIYYCPQTNPLVDCRAEGEFTAMNSSLSPSTNYSKDSTTAPEIISGEGDYCFYVEACDDCDAQGTCSSNGGSPNCSGFPSGGADSTLYVKCLTLTEIPDTAPPAWPSWVTEDPGNEIYPCYAPPEGNKIELSWNKVCYYADGTEFTDGTNPNCATPTPEQVVGYKVIHGASGAIPSAASAGASDIAGSTSVGSPTSIDHTNLVNGTQYCYNVYAVDAGANFSTDGPGGTKVEVCCTPDDTVAPSKPTMDTIAYTSISCSPTWNSVSDKDTLTYSVYRCDGGSTECTSSGDFTSVSTGITNPLSYPDYDVTTDETYTYCVTAVDAKPNESAVYETGSTTNCGICTPSDRPNPPTDAGAAVQASETGAKVYWTNSVDDDSSGGYNVYRCSTSGCSSATAVQSCVDGDRTPASPLLLNGEPVGDWYYGVTYMKDCEDEATESFLTDVPTAISDSAVTIISVTPACETQCIIVSSCKDYDADSGCVPVTSVDTSQTGSDGKFLSTGMSGLEVYLADTSSNLVGDTTTTTDSNGNYKLVINNAVAGLSTSSNYYMILKVPSAQKSGIACSPGFSGDDCYIILSKEVEIEEDTNVKISGLQLGGGGRAEIGNPDCSDSVDVGDLLILKAAFGSSTGGDSYKTYSDFDGNGTIDVEDFLILKKNFGKVLDAAPSTDANLCKQ